MKNLVSKRLRQLRLNIAYKQSDEELSEAIKALMGTNEYKLHIRHHSHQLTTHVKNAMRYNRERTNGITVAILVSPALARPVFGYTVCSVEDTFSRLIGRVQAKENLIKTLTLGNAQVLNVADGAPESPTRDQQFYRYINQVITQNAPRIKEVTKDAGVHPLTFIDENALTLEIKQLIAKTFGANTKEIEGNFVYIRRFSNNFFGNQFASHADIIKFADENPDDNVQLESTGGFTVGVFKFKHNDVDHLIYSTTLCLPEDHFNKSLGRKTVLRNIQRSDLFKNPGQINKKDRASKLAGIFKASSLPEKAIMLDQLSIHAIGERFGLAVNTYVGGVRK